MDIFNSWVVISLSRTLFYVAMEYEDYVINVYWMLN